MVLDVQDLPVLDVELVKRQDGFGFNIIGGTDAPHFDEDHGIFIAKVKASGAATLDGRLHEGDKILSVNDIPLTQVTHEEAVALFKQAGAVIKLKVQQGMAGLIRAKQGGANVAGGGGGRSATTFYLLVGVSSVAVVMAVVIYRYKHKFNW